MPFKFSQFLASNTDRAFEMYENLHHSKIRYISNYSCSTNSVYTHVYTSTVTGSGSNRRQIVYPYTVHYLSCIVLQATLNSYTLHVYMYFP